MNSPRLAHPAWLARTPAWLRRLALGLASALALVATFAVASVVFAALLVIGLAVAGWLWWQYRKLARRVHDAQPAVLEGEYEIESAPPALEDQTADHAGRSSSDRAPSGPRAS